MQSFSSRMKYLYLVSVVVGIAAVNHLASGQQQREQEKQFKICLTGTTVKINRAYGEAFFNGAYLATQDSTVPISKKVVVEKHYYDSAPLSAARITEEMIQKNCHFIVGYTNGVDLSLASRVLKDSPRVVFSLYGEIDSHRTYSPGMRTFQVSPETLMAKLFHHLDQKKVSFKNAFIVTAVDRLSLVKYRDWSERELKKRRVQSTSVNILERNPHYEKVVRMYEKAGKPDVLFLLTRAIIAAEIAERIKKKFGTLPLVIGTKNFGSAQLPAFIHRMKNSEGVEGYFARSGVVDDPDPAYVAYRTHYVNTYGKEPMVISGMAYDAVKFALKVLTQHPEAIDSATSFLKAARRTSYQGMTGVEINRLSVRPKRAFIIHMIDDQYQTTQYKGGQS